MPAILRVERVTRTFAGLRALKDVSFAVEEGAICGLIGPNGAGKTTLLAVIAGALRPTSGGVIFQGRDLTGAKSFAVARAGIVRTHQVPKPFRSLSVLENVEVGRRFGRAGAARGSSDANHPNDSSDATRVLERVGLAGRAQALAGTLSVGDQKRLELARCLAARPSLLLCDEVCSGLTEGETASVLRLMRQIRDAGTTILYVEHNLKAIMAVCDHVVVLNYGEKLAEGAPAAVRLDPAVIEAYIGSREASSDDPRDATGASRSGDPGVAGS
jgi:ABC-type branched-subunit amino acid transport system ATPase component